MPPPVKQLSDGNPGGTGLGQGAADVISFYGVTPVSQRAGTVQATSNVTATSNNTATLTEIANTLIGLGIWKGGP
jgi:hypothetical protein